MVGLTPHTPQHYTRMVTVASDHLFHLLLLNLCREFLVFYTRCFLIYYNAKFICQLVYRLVIGIVGRLHKIIIQIFSNILKVHNPNPFWDGISKPGIILITVSTMDDYFFTIHIEEVFFIIPFKPTKAQRTRIIIRYCLSVNYLRINLVQVWIII